MKKNLTLCFSCLGPYTARILKVYKFAFLIFRFARKLFSKIFRFARKVFFLSRKINKVKKLNCYHFLVNFLKIVNFVNFLFPYQEEEKEEKFKKIYMYSFFVNYRNCFVIQVGSDLLKILFFFKKLLLELVINLENLLLLEKKVILILINKIFDLNNYTSYKSYAS